MAASWDTCILSLRFCCWASLCVRAWCRALSSLISSSLPSPSISPSISPSDAEREDSSTMTSSSWENSGISSALPRQLTAHSVRWVTGKRLSTFRGKVNQNRWNSLSYVQEMRGLLYLFLCFHLVLGACAGWKRCCHGNVLSSLKSQQRLFLPAQSFQEVLQNRHSLTVSCYSLRYRNNHSDGR